MMSKENLCKKSIMDRLYQAARAQLPILYDIVDRVSHYFNNKPPVYNAAVNQYTGSPIKYNLRPRKPVHYKV